MKMLPSRGAILGSYKFCFTVEMMTGEVTNSKSSIKEALSGTSSPTESFQSIIMAGLKP
jgi:hypothetical protein